MKHMDLNKLTRALRILVVAAFVCNILALFFVPLLVVLSPKETAEAGLRGLGYLFGVFQVPTNEIYVPFHVLIAAAWVAVWEKSYHAVLTVFLWACGVCTAVILWQAKRVLDTMLRGTPFVMENARYLRRAALCCFVISAAALSRTVWGFFYYKSLGPLLTYNFLFCPLFLMAGLLFLVMSALFRQAAELKAENDLTI